MSTPKAPDMPGGYPDLSALKAILTPERLNYIKNHHAESAFVKDFSARLAKDPTFMKHVESMLQSQGNRLDSEKLVTQFKSHGWEPLASDELPSPKQAAAAVGAAVAAMVVPVPVPI